MLPLIFWMPNGNFHQIEENLLSAGRIKDHCCLHIALCDLDGDPCIAAFVFLTKTFLYFGCISFGCFCLVAVDQEFCDSFSCDRIVLLTTLREIIS